MTTESASPTASPTSIAPTSSAPDDTAVNSGDSATNTPAPTSGEPESPPLPNSDRGARTVVFLDEGPSSVDTVNASRRALQRSEVIEDPNSNYLGFVRAGDSLFVTLPTEESIAVAQAIQDAADAARGTTALDQGETVSEDQSVETIRSFIQTNLTEPLDELGINAFLNSALIALNESESGQPVSPERVQQNENNSTARIAQALGAASFVNNSIDPSSSGDTILTFNPANPEFDGGPTIPVQADRPPRQFTFEEVTTSRLSINDFRAGDTIVIPRNIVQESERLRQESMRLNVETSVIFISDGSTFNSPELLSQLEDVIDATLGANSLGDGSTISGEFGGVTPLSELAEFTGGTELTVAGIHTHPARFFAALPENVSNLREITGDEVVVVPRLPETDGVPSESNSQSSTADQVSNGDSPEDGTGETPSDAAQQSQPLSQESTQPDDENSFTANEDGSNFSSPNPLSEDDDNTDTNLDSDSLDAEDTISDTSEDAAAEDELDSLADEADPTDEDTSTLSPDDSSPLINDGDRADPDSETGDNLSPEFTAFVESAVDELSDSIFDLGPDSFPFVESEGFGTIFEVGAPFSFTGLADLEALSFNEAEELFGVLRAAFLQANDVIAPDPSEDPTGAIDPMTASSDDALVSGDDAMISGDDGMISGDDGMSVPTSTMNPMADESSLSFNERLERLKMRFRLS